MAKTIQVTVFEDPGHGWAKVARSQLVKLGIKDEITAFSYQRNNHVYLEEDCDLATYYEALKRQGYQVNFKYLRTNKSSKIRSYDYYQA